MDNQETLHLRGEDTVQVGDIFGKMSQKIGGIGGTLHVTTPADMSVVPQIAWDLSQKTGKPVVIVVKAAN